MCDTPMEEKALWFKAFGSKVNIKQRILRKKLQLHKSTGKMLFSAQRQQMKVLQLKTWTPNSVNKKLEIFHHLKPSYVLRILQKVMGVSVLSA